MYNAQHAVSAVRTCRRCERRGPTAAWVSCVPALHPAPHAAPPPHTSPPHTALRRTHAHSALLHSGPSHSYNYSETMLTMAALPAGVTPSTTSSSQQTDGGGRDTWGISRHEACILLTVVTSGWMYQSSLNILLDFTQYFFLVLYVWSSNECPWERIVPVLIIAIGQSDSGPAALRHKNLQCLPPLESWMQTEKSNLVSIWIVHSNNSDLMVAHY